MHNRLKANLIHIYHFLESADDYCCEVILKIVKEKTQSLKDVERFIEVTLFDALIGNHDRHGRNLGLIQIPMGFELSPFYDNPTYLAIEEEFLLSAQHEPRGRIATLEIKEPKMIDYVLEWNRLGYKDLIQQFSDKVSVDKIVLLIRDSFISDKRQNALITLIVKRNKELIDGLASIS